MKIYDDCGRWSGPQIQMMFPIICIGNVGYSKECLFDYYIHDHNRIKEDKQLLIKTKEAIKLWNSVFSECSKFVSDNNLAKYREIVYKRLNSQLMNYAFRCNDKEAFNYFFGHIDQKTFKEHIKHTIIHNNFLFEVYCKLKNRR